MSDSKFEKLVYRFEPEYMTIKDEAGNETEMGPNIYFRGGCQIPGANFNIGYGYITKAGIIDRYPHKHPSDEYLVFGAGTLNSKDWDAEIELTIGIGDDAEVYTIDGPTTVYIPAGVWHCPLDVKRVGKPVWFQPALFQGMFGGTYALPEGEKELTFNGPIDCILGEDKKCDCCRKCLSRSWEKV